ncbi:MAG: HAMP domain-containing histidine kinase [Candidatus Gastranaerophilales bacterium]|nr:HAMP domain-containing histidine kinase [Candidatus Gastranaerophilales bacterium]
MQKNIKEEFISTLSHEIRTPLTSIKGFSQTMLNSWEVLDDEKKKEFLEIILNQSKRLINLVENVLNVARIDSNSSSLILTKVEINKLIQNCANMLKISNPEYKFNFELTKNELNCLIDSDKTQQILINILDNAIKYSINSKKIEIKTSNKLDFNVISIKNYGNYIEDDYLNKIFEKFYRIDSYIKSQAQGSGLGLYIAKSLVEKMQGKIEVISSKKEKFVEFLIYLPIYEVEKLTKNIGV